MTAEPDDTAPALDPDLVPVASWEVRRRRYGEQRWLVRHNQVLEIDPYIDVVWRACGDQITVAAMEDRLADELGLTAEQARAVTGTALGMLATIGFVALDGD